MTGDDSLFRELDAVEDMMDKESKLNAFDNMIQALNQCIETMAQDGDEIPVISYHMKKRPPRFTAKDGSHFSLAERV